MAQAKKMVDFTQSFNGSSVVSPKRW